MEDTLGMYIVVVVGCVVYWVVVVEVVVDERE